MDMKIVHQCWRTEIENERGYAAHWKSSDPQMEELEVANCLLGYLKTVEDWAGATLATNERDPPDCIGWVAGQKFGIEMTELVHQPMVEAHQVRRKAEKGDVPASARPAFPGDIAEWTTSSLQKKLASIVRVKDKAAADGPFSPYMVAIYTDEPMVTPELVKEALATLAAETNHIDRAYLLLSQHPRAEDFPNHIPVFRLPLMKKS